VNFSAWEFFCTKVAVTKSGALYKLQWPSGVNLGDNCCLSFVNSMLF
jgi:hypothetical protein